MKRVTKLEVDQLLIIDALNQVVSVSDAKLEQLLSNSANLQLAQLVVRKLLNAKADILSD